MNAPFSLLLMLLAGFLTMGCKTGTIEPELFGDIEGRVLDAETELPISGVTITTSPPSGAIGTDEDGAFRIENVTTGNYTITANRLGYQATSATVSVRRNQTTQARLVMRPTAEGAQALEVTVLSWRNRTAGDTTTVNTEYRVRNAGTTAISAYEVYFRIETTGDTFYSEVRGGALQPSQQDIASFTKPIFENRATNVTVDGTWVPGQTSRTED